MLVPAGCLGCDLRGFRQQLWRDERPIDREGSSARWHLRRRRRGAGFLAAYDAEAGKLKWKFWTIPAPGEFGSSSWPGESYLHGGGTTWMPGAYDPQLNTVYWTTSNPAPDFDGEVRPGDDLYTDCVVALDADTGKLKWHFQFTPHDLYDYDANETPMLIDLKDAGAPSGGLAGHNRLLVQANRNGFLYILDRTDGKFLKATQFAKKLNWAKGIEPQGRPMLTGNIPTAKGTDICPGIDGATNWYSPSYNPQTRMVYFLALENCNTYFSKPAPFVKGEMFYSTGPSRFLPKIARNPSRVLHPGGATGLVVSADR